MLRRFSPWRRLRLFVLHRQQALRSCIQAAWAGPLMPTRAVRWVIGLTDSLELLLGVAAAFGVVRALFMVSYRQQVPALVCLSGLLVGLLLILGAFLWQITPARLTSSGRSRRLSSWMADRWILHRHFFGIASNHLDLEGLKLLVKTGPKLSFEVYEARQPWLCHGVGLAVLLWAHDPVRKRSEDIERESLVLAQVCPVASVAAPKRRRI